MTSVLGPGKKGFPLAIGFCRQGGVGPPETRLGWKAKGEGSRKTLWSL
jgi:hypothetical protein